MNIYAIIGIFILFAINGWVSFYLGMKAAKGEEPLSELKEDLTVYEPDELDEMQLEIVGEEDGAKEN